MSKWVSDEFWCCSCEDTTDTQEIYTGVWMCEDCAKNYHKDYSTNLTTTEN